MRCLDFVKMAGAGNDFILADNRKNIISGSLSAIAARFCDRKRSVGADGLILVEKSKSADIRMRILNPDGSEAEMCGNGVRCLGKFAADKRITGKKMTVETLAGRIGVEVRGDIVKAKMIEPKDFRLNLNVPLGGKNQKLHFVNTGVPHAVMVLESIGAVDVENTGRLIRFHSFFAPRGANANFISFRRDNGIEIRTYERGVENETLACGTGSTAGALIAASLKNLKSPVAVHTKGGDKLKVYFSKKNGAFCDVYLEGAVQTSFQGRVSL